MPRRCRRRWWEQPTRATAQRARATWNAALVTCRDVGVPIQGSEWTNVYVGSNSAVYLAMSDRVPNVANAATGGLPYRCVASAA